MERGAHGRSATGPRARARAPTTSPPRSTAPTPSACARSTRAGEHRRRRDALLRAGPHRPGRADDHERRRRPTGNGTLAALVVHAARPGTSAECRIERGATVVSDWAPCASPKTLRPRGRGRRDLHVPRPLDRRRGQHRHRRDRHLRPRPRRPPRRPTITGGPTGDSQNADARLHVHRRGRRDVRVPHDARRHGRQRLGGLHRAGHSYNLTAQADGAYTFHVRATDAAGNTGAGRHAQLHARPHRARRAGHHRRPAAERRRRAAVLLVHATRPGATRELPPRRAARRWSATGRPARAPRATTSPPRPTAPTPSASGPPTPAGNTGADATRTYTLDRVAPDAPTITGAPGGGHQRRHADLDVHRRRRRRRSTTAASSAARTVDHATGRSARARTPTTSPASPTARTRSASAASDDAGNESARRRATRSRSTARAPAAPTITGGPTGDSQNAMPSYTFTAEAGLVDAVPRRARRDGRQRLGGLRRARAATTSRCSPTAPTPSACARPTPPATPGAERTRTYTLDRTAPGRAGDHERPRRPTRTTTRPSTRSPARPARRSPAASSAAATVVSDWARVLDAAGLRHQRRRSTAPTPSASASTDAAGNTSADGTRVYALDRQAPGRADADRHARAPTRTTRRPTWAYTAAAGDRRRPAGSSAARPSISDWAACTEPAHATTSRAQVDGSYTFRVRATDAAGQHRGRDGRHDRARPRQPAGADDHRRPDGDDAPTRRPRSRFTHEAGANASCRIERGATVVSDWARVLHRRAATTCPRRPTATTRSASAPPTPPATPAPTPRARSRSTAPAPNQPSITARPGGLARTTTRRRGAGPPTPTRTTTAASRAAPRSSSTGRRCASPRTFDLSAEPDGTYTFRVRVERPRGQRLDARPTTPSRSTASRRPRRRSPRARRATRRTSAPSYSFTAEAGADHRLPHRARRDGRRATGPPASSPRAYDLSLQADGTYTFRVRATDAAANTGAEATRSYTLDRTPPAAPTITAGPTGDSAGRHADLRVDRRDRLLERVPRRARGDGRRRLGRRARPRTRHDLSARGRRRLHLPRPLDRRRRQHGRRQHAHLHARPHRPGRPDGHRRPDRRVRRRHADLRLDRRGGLDHECRVERGATVVSDWTLVRQPADLRHLRRGRRRLHLLGPRDRRRGQHRRGRDARLHARPRRAGGADDHDAAGGRLERPDPAWGWSAAADAVTFRCRIERGATVVSDWAACTDPRTYDLSLQPDGDLHLPRPRQRRRGQRGRRRHRHLHARPHQPGRRRRSPPGRPARSQDDTPTFAWTGEVGAASECRIERGATVVIDWAPCSSAATFDISGEADGVYTFRVRSTDAAGTPAPPSSRTYTLDRTDPAAPTITAGPTGESADETPTFAWTAEAGCDHRVPHRARRDDRRATGRPARARAPSTSPARSTARTRFRVRATDAAGNTGPDATRTYTLDRTPPAAPTVTTRPAADSSDQTPTWGWSADADAVTFRCRVERGATVVSDWAACTDPQHVRPRGRARRRLHLPRARQRRRRQRGRRRHRHLHARPHRPARADDHRRPDRRSRRTTRRPSRGPARPASTSECRIERGATVVDDWATCTSPATFDLSGRGRRRLHLPASARSTRAGNTGADSSRSYTLDRTAPGRADGRHRARDRLDRRQPDLRLRRRGRRDARVPPGRAARPWSTAGRRARARRPTTSAPSPTARYTLLRPRDRRRRQHRRRGDAHLHARPHRRRPRRSSTRGPATTATTARRSGPSRRASSTAPSSAAWPAAPRSSATGARASARASGTSPSRSTARTRFGVRAVNLGRHAQPRDHRPLPPRHGGARRAGHLGRPGGRLVRRHARRGRSAPSRARRSSAAWSAARPSISDWAACSSPQGYDLGRRARRHLHLPHPRDRRGRQHRRRRAAPPTTSTAPCRSSRSSASTRRPPAATTRRPSEFTGEPTHDLRVPRHARRRDGRPRLGRLHQPVHAGPHRPSRRRLHDRGRRGEPGRHEAARPPPTTTSSTARPRPRR